MILSAAVVLINATIIFYFPIFKGFLVQFIIHLMQKIHTFLIQQDFLYLRSGEIERHIRSSRQIIADIQKIPIAIIIYFEILMGLQKAIGVGDAVSIALNTSSNEIQRS